MAISTAHIFFVVVDDILIVEKDPHKFISIYLDTFIIKTSSMLEKKIYLGTEIVKVHYDDGSYEWSICLYDTF